MPAGKRSLHNVPSPEFLRPHVEGRVLDYENRLYDYLCTLEDQVGVIQGWLLPAVIAGTPGVPAGPVGPGTVLGPFQPEQVFFGSPAGMFAQDPRLTWYSAGIFRVGGLMAVGIVSAPRARIHVAAQFAGPTNLHSAPLLFNGSRELLDVMADGCFEYQSEPDTLKEDSDLPHLWFTATTNGVNERYDLLEGTSSGSPPVGGTGVAPQVAFWSTPTGTLAGDAAFLWGAAAKTLTINTALEYGLAGLEVQHAAGCGVFVGEDLANSGGLTWTAAGHFLALGAAATHPLVLQSAGGYTYVTGKLGANVLPTSRIHAAAHTAAAGTAPLQIDSFDGVITADGAPAAATDGIFEYEHHPGSEETYYHHLWFTAQGVTGAYARYDLLAGLAAGGGVSTHALLSAMHTDTTAASPTRGDIITGQGVSAKWTRLAKGGAGDVLTMGANEPAWIAGTASLGWTGTPTQNAYWNTADNLTGHPDWFVSYVNGVGSTWTSRADNHYWANISISANGQYQLAAPGWALTYLMASTDYGQTWANVTAPGSRDWYGVAVSATGKYQIAVAMSTNYVYQSSDFGVTWTSTPLPAAYDWDDVAMSASGRYRTIVGNVHSGGNGYISSDYGVTWAQRDVGGEPRYVSMSSDGCYQTVTASGYAHVSSNYGGSFTNVLELQGVSVLSKPAVSATGHYQGIRTESASGLLYRSSQYGVPGTWSIAGPVGGGGGGLTMSASGQLLTTSIGAALYMSYDYGGTWVATGNMGNPGFTVAMSADGKYQTAGQYGGKLYVYGNPDLVVSLGNPSPLDRLSIQQTGTLSGLTDLLSLANSQYGVSMTDTRTGLRFDQWYYNATTPAVAAAGRIAVGTGGNWGIPSTRNSYMGFFTSAAGTVAERMRIPSTGGIRLLGTTSGYVGLTPAAVAGSQTYTLPNADGNAGQVLATSGAGAGVLSWVNGSSIPGALTGSGSTGQVAYWTGPYALSSEGAFTYNATDDILSVTGAVKTGYFTSNAVPASPAAGDLWYSSVAQSFKMRKMGESHGVVGRVHSMSAVIMRDSATLTEQDLGSKQFYANTLTLNKSVRITSGGYWQNSDGLNYETATLRFYLGAYSVDVAGLGFPANDSGTWYTSVEFTIVTVGGAGVGKYRAVGIVVLTTASDGTSQSRAIASGAEIGLDTTVSATNKITIDYVGTSTTTALTQETFTVEVLD